MDFNPDYDTFDMRLITNYIVESDKINYEDRYSIPRDTVHNKNKSEPIVLIAAHRNLLLPSHIH